MRDIDEDTKDDDEEEGTGRAGVEASAPFSSDPVSLFCVSWLEKTLLITEGSPN
jgi:hypothetical protein